MSEPVKETALRMALRSMLNDVTYPERRKSRDHTEAQLAQEHWHLHTRTILMRRALWWARAQSPGVEAALRKALGEETQTQDIPGTRSADQARPAPLSTTIGMLQQQRIAPMAPTVNEIPTSMQEEVMALYNDAELQELHRQAEYMNKEPYNTPPDKHAKAVATILAGRVHAADDSVHPWQVAGEKDTPNKRILYMVSKDGCSCPHAEKTNQGRYGCYHAVAAELYDRWQKALQPGLFTPPKRLDERVAATPTQTAQDAPGATNAPQDASQDVPAVTLSPDAPGEVAGRPDTGSVPRLTLRLPRRSISAIVADLSKPLARGCVATRPEEGTQVPFLHKETVSNVLDTYAPGWHGAVVRIDHIAQKLILTYRITIPCLEGEVAREATGQEDDIPLTRAGKKAYGDSSSNAEAMAFKRAAAKFGVGAWLYDNDDGTSQALTAHLKDERAKLLAELGKVVDEHGLAREEVITWLRSQTGAGSNAHIPLWAIQTLLAHLSTPASMAQGVA